MKKQYLFLLAVALFLGCASSGFAQELKMGTPIPLPLPTEKEQGAPVVQKPVDGIIPRTYKAKNPLQMINPAAPASYGTGRTLVISDTFTRRPSGLKMFAFVF